MMAVGLSSEEAEAEILQADLIGKVGIACVNSPMSVTMSGDAAAVITLSKDLQGRGIFARKLNTGGKAYHSHHMAVLGPELERLIPLALKSLPPSDRLKSDAEFFSSVTGEPKSTGFDATYWKKNMESPVLFSQAVQCLMKKGDVHLVEIGPHSALELPIKQIRKELDVTEDRIPYSCSLTRGQDAAECCLNLLGRLFVHGLPISFHNINTQDVTISPRVLPDLPPYPRTYEGILWKEPRVSRETRHRRDRHHELLGSHVAGGDGLTQSWRNMLQIKHVKWLESHKLEETVIFPGAGYIAMAIEAISQTLRATRARSTSFRLRNVNILTALVLASETETELFTTIRPKQLSSASRSKDWWDFEIVSYTDGYSSLHASGSISLHTSGEMAHSVLPTDKKDIAKMRSGPWYDRLSKAGLNFGPDFRSIKEVGVQTGGGKPYRYGSTVLPFLQNSSYVIHPITIDALLQSGIIANAGSLRNVQAKVPVSIEAAEFHTAEVPPTDLCSIHSMAKTVGFGAIEMSAELSSDGYIYGQMNKVRMAPYSPATQQVAGPRQPMLRVVWKPDIYVNCWDNQTFAQHLNSVQPSSTPGRVDVIRQVLSLLHHKNPRLRILELSDEHADFGYMFSDETFPPTGSYTAGYLSETGELFGTQVRAESVAAKISGSASHISDEKYDLIVLPSAISADLYLHAMLPELKNLLTQSGLVMAATPPSQTYGFERCGLSTVFKDLIDFRITIAKVTKIAVDDKKPTIIVERDDAGESSRLLVQNMLKVLDSFTKKIKFSEITKETIPSGSVIYSALEVERPLLSTLTEHEMTSLKVITDHASKVAWATGGGFLSQANPDFALASGVARAIMVEQPALTFCTFDVNQALMGSQQTAQNFCSILHQTAGGLIDYEFIQHDSLVHVSRFVQDRHSNQTFRQKLGNETMAMPLSQARPSRLTMATPGQFETVEFEKDTPMLESELQIGHVEVEVQAVGLNAKGVQVLSGKNETLDGAWTLEHCGIIKRTAKGGSSTGLVPGDRVVVMAPGYMKTQEIAPEWACFKLKDEEMPTVVCTLPVVFSTALYALHHLARVQRHETVLIHEGSSEVGNAAIQIAKLADVEIFTTASTAVQRNFLASKFGLRKENILSSETNSICEDIMMATKGRGVDVVLSSLSGDLLHDSWNACAPHGRFIQLGKKDLVDAGKLDMDVFKRNATFSALDMGSFFYDDRPITEHLWAKLLADVMDLYRTGKIHPIEPLETFDVSQMSRALRRFHAQDRMGKVSISFENPESILQVHPLKYNLRLDEKKTYILVGCLGGLGRSISKWMVARGARDLVFIGRSGLDKKPARVLVQELQAAGAAVKVVRGDVCNPIDVQRAVAQADRPIGGIIQAAMGLSEALFTKMSNQSWHTGIDPKLQGCWNLHNAIKGKDDQLDFFFMTSSVSGSIGQAAQANYCAANYALDMFARYRRSLGLPAIAVGFGMISEVGYLHENPDIEAILSRSGITALDEDELLQILDIALSQPSDTSLDSFSKSHILTGVEPSSVDSFPAKSDPRTLLLLTALENQEAQSTEKHEEEEEENAAADTNPRETATARIRKQFAKLLSMQLEKVDVTKNLAAFGLDSMMGTEFRTWLFQNFKVDIPFFEFLDSGTTIERLSEKVVSAS